jgi:hypothetical protein
MSAPGDLEPDSSERKIIPVSDEKRMASEIPKFGAKSLEQKDTFGINPNDVGKAVRRMLKGRNISEIEDNGITSLLGFPPLKWVNRGIIGVMFTVNYHYIVHNVRIEGERAFRVDGKLSAPLLPPQITPLSSYRVFKHKSNMKYLGAAGNHIGLFIGDEPVHVIKIPIIVVTGSIEKDSKEWSFYWIKSEKKNKDTIIPAYYLVKLKDMSFFLVFIEKSLNIFGGRIEKHELKPRIECVKISKKMELASGIGVGSALLILGFLFFWIWYAFIMHSNWWNPYNLSDLVKLLCAGTGVIMGLSFLVFIDLKRKIKEILRREHPRRHYDNPLMYDVSEDEALLEAERLDERYKQYFLQAFYPGYDRIDERKPSIGKWRNDL